MSSYNILSMYYDRLTENVDYKVRSDYISDFFKRQETEGCTVLDLACGTGTLTKLMEEKGFRMTGMDISEDMLTVASSKSTARFIRGDMKSFDFNEAFDGCICCLDSINHLNSADEWISCFASVCKSIKKGGLFVFDMNTVYKHNETLADNSFVFDEEDFFLAWDNEYVNNGVVRIILDFFIYNGRNYDRYSEEFTETAFDTETVIKFLNDNFEIIGIYDDLTLDAPKSDSERVYFVCKKR